jgi:DNA-binding NarL/FixJ family response regulator
MTDTPARILIADDDGEIRSAYRELLETLPCVITEAVNGEEAFQIAQESKYHLYLTDIRMPKMGGFEYISQLKRVDPGAVIVIISGIDDINYSLRAIEYGAWRYLIKPVTRNTFYDVVQLGLRESLRHLPIEEHAAVQVLLEAIKQAMNPVKPAPPPPPPVVLPIPPRPAPQPIPASSVPAPVTSTAPAHQTEADLTAYREKLRRIVDEEIAEFSRRLIELKQEAMQDIQRRLSEFPASPPNGE